MLLDGFCIFFSYSVVLRLLLDRALSAAQVVATFFFPLAIGIWIGAAWTPAHVPPGNVIVVGQYRLSSTSNRTIPKYCRQGETPSLSSIVGNLSRSASMPILVFGSPCQLATNAAAMRSLCANSGSGGGASKGKWVCGSV